MKIASRFLIPALALVPPAVGDVGRFVSDDMTLVFTDVQEFNSGPIFGRQGLLATNIARGAGDGWGNPWPDGYGGIGLGTIGNYDGFGPEVGSGWKFQAFESAELRSQGFFIASFVADLTLGFTNLTDGQSDYLITAELSGLSTTAAWRGDPEDIGVFSAQVLLRTKWPGGAGGDWYSERNFTSPFTEEVIDGSPLVFHLDVPAGAPEYGQNYSSIEVRVLYTSYFQAVPTSGASALAFGAFACVARRRGR